MNLLKNTKKQMEYKVNDEIVKVKVTKKQIRNFIIKIRTSDLIEISVPIKAKEKQIMELMDKKNKWIKDAIDKLKTNIRKDAEFKNGNLVTILGKKYEIVFKKSIRNYISIEDDFLIVESINFKNLDTLYESFIKKESKKYYLERMEILHKLIGIKPTLQIKKLKQTWGICSYLKKKITIGTNLYKYPPECVDYVILHELAHLIEPNHSKKFYNIIFKFMPDYKSRIEKLKEFHGIENKQTQ
jgi:predicted metal-dependent hydrolase